MPLTQADDVVDHHIVHEGLYPANRGATQESALSSVLLVAPGGSNGAKDGGDGRNISLEEADELMDLVCDPEDNSEFDLDDFEDEETVLDSLFGRDEEYVEVQASAEQERLAQRFPILSSFLPNQWLDDESINLFTSTLNADPRFQENGVYFASTLLVSAMHDRGGFTKKWAKRWDKKVKFSEMKKVRSICVYADALCFHILIF